MMSAVAESIMGDNAKPAGVPAASEPLRAAAANEAQVAPAASAAGSVKTRSLQ